MRSLKSHPMPEDGAVYQFILKKEAEGKHFFCCLSIRCHWIRLETFVVCLGGEKYIPFRPWNIDRAGMAYL